MVVVHGGFVAGAELVRHAVLAKAVAEGWSVKRLAARCLISQPHMHQWLAGKKNLSLRLLDHVCVMLGLEEFMGGE